MRRGMPKTCHAAYLAGYVILVATTIVLTLALAGSAESPGKPHAERKDLNRATLPRVAPQPAPAAAGYAAAETGAERPDQPETVIDHQGDDEPVGGRDTDKHLGGPR